MSVGGNTIWEKIHLNLSPLEIQREAKKKYACKWYKKIKNLL